MNAYTVAPETSATEEEQMEESSTTQKAELTPQQAKKYRTQVIGIAVVGMMYCVCILGVVPLVLELFQTNDFWRVTLLLSWIIIIIHFVMERWTELNHEYELIKERIQRLDAQSCTRISHPSF